MNTPVKFETSKLLKEKGYNEQTIDIYQDGEILRLKSTISNKEFMTSRNYSAPTIAEVVMWLYEKYKIWIQVFILNKTFAWKVQDVNTLVITCLYAQQDKGYNSPTEAYEAAIEFTLKNLI